MKYPVRVRNKRTQVRLVDDRNLKTTEVIYTYEIGENATGLFKWTVNKAILIALIIVIIAAGLGIAQ